MSMSPTPYRSGNRLDDQVNTEFMRVCKCVLPYLDRGMQKNLAISLKALELISVMQLYSAEPPITEVPLMRLETLWLKAKIHLLLKLLILFILIH